MSHNKAYPSQAFPDRHADKGLLRFALTGMGVVPTFKAHVPDDLVDVVHNPLDHDRGVTVSHLFEEFRQGVLPAVFLFNPVRL